MTHADAQGGGETPAPRKIDEPRERPEAPSNRAPWCPDNAGPYRLPGGIRDRLTAALAGFKNRDAAFALAVFLGRFWSSPSRLPCAFPIDRRALAEHEALELTEARVRGALLVLIGVGFLTRCEPEAGKRYQRTEGGLQRRAILHRFGEEFAVEFGKANTRAQAARGAPAPARRPIPRPEEAPRPPAAKVAARGPVSPAPVPRRRDPVPASQLAQKQNSPERGMIMGERPRRQTPSPSASPLEAALERLRQGMGL